MRKLVIAIDGPVGSGKSTLARRVAELLGYSYLDSGAMYRALAWKALRSGLPFDDPERLVALAGGRRIELRAGGSEQRVLLDGEDVTAAIRSPEVSEAASKIAMIPGVRQLLVAEQRRAGEDGGIVMEGRDIGTVVFPDADLKIYLTASAEVRAERRWREHKQKGEAIDLARTIEQVRERDRRDRERETSPLVRAPDAILVDSSAMDAEEVARLVVMLAHEKQGSQSQLRTHP
jgi:cytidylate kinase